MELVRETYYLYLRSMKIWLRLPVAVFPPIFISAFLFLVFSASFKNVTSLPGFPASDYNAFLTSMIIVQAVVFSGSDAGFSMMTDMLSGYFDKLLLAPIHRFSILFGALLVAATRALAQAVVIVLIAAGLGVHFETGVVGVIVLILAASAFGVVWSCLGIIIALKTKSAQATQASFTLFFPFIFLTTGFMPKEFLSGWFKTAATVNPVTYVLDAMRALVITGWDWSTLLTGVGVLAGMTAFLIAGATWLYRRTTA